MNSTRETTESRLERHVQKLYEIGDDSCTTRAWRDQAQLLRGFIDALKVSQSVEPQVIRQIIDETHLRIFGESRVVRRSRIKTLSDTVLADNWDSLNAPAFVRRSTKT